MNPNDIHGMALALGLPSAIAQLEAVKLLVAEAVENEREACANLCEDQAQEYYSDGSKRAMNYQCADAIRSRGEA